MTQLSGQCSLVWFHPEKCPCPEKYFVQGNNLRCLQISGKQNRQALLLAINEMIIIFVLIETKDPLVLMFNLNGHHLSRLRLHPTVLLGVWTFWGVHLLTLKEIWHVIPLLFPSAGKQFMTLFYITAS